MKTCAVAALAVIIVALLGLYVGLSERQSYPARVDENALAEKGWKEVGEVGRTSVACNLSFISVKINVATMNYTDEELRTTLQSYVQSFGVPLSVPEEASSRLVTIRIMPPMIADIFKDEIGRYAESMLEDQYVGTVRSYGVKDFSKTGEISLNVHGRNVRASVYEGNLGFGGASLKVKGITAVWAEDGIIAAMGVVPAGEVKYKLLGREISLHDFGESEFNEMIYLVEHIS